MLSNEQLLQVLSSSNNAVAIHVTDQFNIQYATDPMLAIWGKGRASISGMPKTPLPLPQIARIGSVAY